MKSLIKENRFFIIPYIFVLIASTILLLSFSKTELHILSNQANAPFPDIFFKYLTFLGDGMVIAILFITLLFVKFRYAFAFLSGSLTTAFIINILKKLVFTNTFRPSKYFELYENYSLHVVEGVQLHAMNSFPSGHTGTAFNVFLMLAFLVRNNYLKLLFFVLAALTGYSRVYLSQHFMVDIVVGSFLGACIMLFFFYWFEKMDKNWLDKSIIRIK